MASYTHRGRPARKRLPVGAGDETVQVTFWVKRSLVRRAMKIARWLSTVKVELTYTDIFRMAISGGLDRAEKADRDGR